METDVFDWKDVPSPLGVTVLCQRAGCISEHCLHDYGWGEAVHHTAFLAEEPDLQVQVVAYPSENGDGEWTVAGYLGNDLLPLSPERVKRFNAFYNSAVALAAELNAGEPTC